MYGILKYPSIALMYFRNLEGRCYILEEELIICTLFSCLVYKHDSEARRLLAEGVELDFVVLQWFRLEQFPAASYELCVLLHRMKHDDPYWCYFVTGWCIIGNYQELWSRLHYTNDHIFIAEKLDRPIPKAPLTLKILRVYPPYQRVFYKASFECPDNTIPVFTSKLHDSPTLKDIENVERNFRPD